MRMAATETLPLLRSQVKDAGLVLGHAFWDDPLWVYLMPDEAHRAKGLPWFMTVAARYGAKFGHPYTTARKIEGVALWLPPGERTVSPVWMLANGLLLAPFNMGMGGFRRFIKAMSIFEHVHERDMTGKHWYLMGLGVDPPRQGQGIGSALMAPILARADDERLPCYLETLKTKNVPFYQKHGFEVVVEDDMPDSRLHYWTMKRMPR